jgi:hypothetical protein
MSKLWLKVFFIVAAIFLLSFFIVYRSSNIADYDSFYHIAHAKIYAEHGIFDTSFPWVQHSAIREFGGDLWYGFHLLLIPFTYLADTSEIKIATLAVTFTSLLLFFFGLRNLGLRYPLLWTLVFPFLSSGVLFRLAMLRPHVLSLGLSFLLFSALYKKQPGLIFFTSLAIAFVHINVIWIPFLIYFVLLLGTYIAKKKIDFSSLKPLAAGIILGVLAHPHLIGTLRLLYVQLVDTMIVKLNNIPLRFGGELYPASETFFTQQVLPALLLAIPLVVILYRKLSDKKQPLIIAGIILTSLYFIMTLAIANRFIELAMGSLIFLLAIIFSALGSGPHIGRPRAIATATVLIFGLSIVSWSSMSRSAIALSESPPYEKFKYPAQWLAQNTSENDIVFHVHWGRFPVLFYWNTHNLYINGMDPIFMYRHSPELYWLNFFIESNQGSAFTCDKMICSSAEAIPTYIALKEHLKVKYVLVQPEVNPAFNEYMAKNPRQFELVFESLSVRIYSIK